MCNTDNNYFRNQNTGLCELCSISDCETCSSLAVCTVCSIGHYVDPNTLPSTCVLISCSPSEYF